MANDYDQMAGAADHSGSTSVGASMRNWRRWLLFAIALGGLARLYVALNAVTISRDSFDYINIAKAFLAGQGWSGVSVIRRPLYPLLVALASRVFQNYELAGRVVSVIFGTLTIPVAFLIGRRVCSQTAGLLAAFFVAIHTYMIRLSGDVLTDSLFHFLLGTVTLSAVAALGRRSIMMVLTAGLFALLLFFARPGAIIVWGCVVVWGLWYLPRLPKIAMAVTGPAILLTMVLCHLFLLLPSQTPELVFPQGSFLSVLEPVFRVTKGLTPLDKLLKFVQDFPQGVTWPLLVLFLWGLVWCWRRGLTPAEKCLLAVTAALWLAYAVISPSERYFTHPMAVALLFAAVGFEDINRRLTARIPRKAAAVAVVLLCLITAAELPRGFVKLHANHLPERLAGQWLLEQKGPGTMILSPSPIIAFYAEGTFIKLPEEAALRDMIESEESSDAEYLAGYDRRLTAQIPDFRLEQARWLRPVKRFPAKKGNYVVYRLLKEDRSAGGM